MARRELSSTLKNLKFMQRASLREEKTKKEEEPEPELDLDLTATTTVTKRCVVIMEGDPHPGALKGRMSFQSFNPFIDKLKEEEARLRQPAAETNTSRNQCGNEFSRENSSSAEGQERANTDKKISEVNGNVKRKHSEVICEEQYPNKSSNNDEGDKQSSRNNSLGSFKQPNVDKLNWNVLRPSSSKPKNELNRSC